MKMKTKAMAAAGILLAAASVVIGQDDKWNFEVTPYFWAAGIEGDATVHGRDVDIDVGFDDIFDAVDAGGGLMTVAQRGSFVVFGQFDYVGMDTDQLDDVPARSSIQTDTFLAALAAGVQFRGPFERSTIDLLGGVRYAWIRNDVEITGVGSAEDSLDIIDGIVMVRPSIRLGERWRLNSTFAVGAGDSDLTWEVQPSIQYAINDNLGLRLGYRRLHCDVEGERGNEFDAALHGVFLGLSLMF